jgi:transposase
MDPEVSDAIWAAIEPILPTLTDAHPLGCHNPRVPDRVCFRGIVIRLVTGASWVDIEAMMDFVVSDTTLRARRDEWIAAGVFNHLEVEARAGYDRILQLDLDVVAVDGSMHKAPCGGEGTGPSPVDRGKLGWKWSVASERAGIPIAWAIDGANRNDVALLEPTLDALAATGLLPDIATLTLDRGYDSEAVRARLHDRGLFDLDIQRRGTKPLPGAAQRLTLGLRWIVEATNTWWSNYGQLRRSTDRKVCHRHAALQLATAVLIVGRLLDYRNRWSPP